MRELALFGAQPLFDEQIFISRPNIPTVEEIVPSLKEIFDSKWLTNNGKYVIAFEKALRQYLGIRNCLVFCNGTLALQLAVHGLRLSSEVITTPFTFAATPHVLYWNNIKPIFCDIDPDTYNIDTEKIESLITPNTTGVLGVHVFGRPCNVVRFEEISALYGLKIVYDAAHAFNVRINNIPVTDFGDLSMLSFHATKIFTTFEGGAICTKNNHYIKRLQFLRNFGIKNEEEVVAPGTNAKMNEFQAAVGLLVLQKVDQEIKRRKSLWFEYIEKLKHIPGIKTMVIPDDITYNYQYFSIEVDPDVFGVNRDELHATLKHENIITRKYFYPLCSEYPCYRALDSARPENLPNAHKVASRILCLPLYAAMEDDYVEQICGAIDLIHQKANAIKDHFNKTGVVA